MTDYSGRFTYTEVRGFHARLNELQEIVDAIKSAAEGLTSDTSGPADLEQVIDLAAELRGTAEAVRVTAGALKFVGTPVGEMR